MEDNISITKRYVLYARPKPYYDLAVDNKIVWLWDPIILLRNGGEVVSTRPGLRVDSI